MAIYIYHSRNATRACSFQTFQTRLRLPKKQQHFIRSFSIMLVFNTISLLVGAQLINALSEASRQEQESRLRLQLPEISPHGVGHFDTICPLGGCDPRHCSCGRRDERFRSVRAAVGCDVLSPDFPLCPIGVCKDNCFCRDVLIQNVHDILFPGQKPDVWYKKSSKEEQHADRTEQKPINVQTEL